MRNLAWYKLLDVEGQIKAQTGVYEVNFKLFRQLDVNVSINLIKKL